MWKVWWDKEWQPVETTVTLLRDGQTSLPPAVAALRSIYGELSRSLGHRPTIIEVQQDEGGAAALEALERLRQMRSAILQQLSAEGSASDGGAAAEQHGGGGGERSGDGDGGEGEGEHSFSRGRQSAEHMGLFRGYCRG